jgi:NAD(P)-dependent dehydrogenase (short-subunit alcohol dehydrogenase family)
VTGGGSGIGEASAKLLAQRGASVLVSDVDPAAAERVASEIEAAGGRAAADRTDVADPDQVEAMVAAAVGRFGGLDVGVNNAGIGGPTAPTGDYPLDGWRTVMWVNLNGVFYCTRAEIGPMRERGGGSIVNMASILGAVGFANSVAYVAAKHGVVEPNVRRQTPAARVRPHGAYRSTRLAPRFLSANCYPNRATFAWRCRSPEIPPMRTTQRSRSRVCSARSSAPGGEWHWHGAAPDHFMTNLLMSEGVAEWASTSAKASAAARRSNGPVPARRRGEISRRICGGLSDSTDPPRPLHAEAEGTL